MSSDWSCAAALIWNTEEEELCHIHELALYQIISRTYNITPVLHHFAQQCVFRPNSMKSVCILLRHGNCQHMCMTEQTVTNFLFSVFTCSLSLLAEETLRLCRLCGTGEPLDKQTAPGPHAKICGSCLWCFKSERESVRNREKAYSEWDVGYCALLTESISISMYPLWMFPVCSFFLLMQEKLQGCEI